jgi:ethanolamine utilization protein EutA (predicted chaperonin)
MSFTNVILSIAFTPVMNEIKRRLKTDDLYSVYKNKLIWYEEDDPEQRSLSKEELALLRDE